MLGEKWRRERYRRRRGAETIGEKDERGKEAQLDQLSVGGGE